MSEFVGDDAYEDGERLAAAVIDARRRLWYPAEKSK